MLYLVDNVLTKVYCLHQIKKDQIYGELENQKPQYTTEQLNELKFPKKQVKGLFHLYRGWIRYKLICLGRVPSHSYRNWILRHIYYMKLGKGAVLYGGFEIRAPWKITIGKGTIIGDECKLDGRNELFIGENVNFSTGVWIWTEQHDLNDPYFSSNDSGGKVVVLDRSWISSRTTILPNVVIGEGAVVAAGALITKDCEPYSIYGGVPGKKIGERNRDLRYNFIGKHEAFF